MNIFGKAVEWYFLAPNQPRGFLEIIAWWEIRRIVYNFVIGSVGLVSLILTFMFAGASAGSHEIPAGEDIVEPALYLSAPFLFNICYTSGEVLELIFGRVWEYNEENGPWATTLLKMGTGISLAMVLFPSVSWGIYLLLQKLGILNN